MVDADMDEAAEKIGDAFEWIAENMDDVVRIVKGGAACLAPCSQSIRLHSLFLPFETSHR